jgi:hypothetical protein
MAKADEAMLEPDHTCIQRWLEIPLGLDQLRLRFGQRRGRSQRAPRRHLQPREALAQQRAQVIRQRQLDPVT